MPFGQASGPPASAKQVDELLRLVQAAGHRDFRDARGPMGFTQRQAAGKFTRDEVSTFIDQLERAEPDGEPVVAEPVRRLSTTERTLGGIPSTDLAAELQRRGWIVVEPE